MEYLALLLFIVVIVALLVAGWLSFGDSRTRRASPPTLGERAAADAARASSGGITGAHDLTAAGPPAFFKELAHDPASRADDQPGVHDHDRRA